MSDLSNIWNKSNCLTQIQLLQYLQQKLEREEVYIVESHINDCPICNDALEGIMHSDLDQIKEHFSSMKSEFGNKLSRIQTIEKSKSSSSNNTTKNLHQSTPENTLKSTSGAKFKWAYAASVLLIIGLGYSVFSFIKDYQQNSNLASNKENPKIKSTETEYTPLLDSSGELMHLETSPEDINQLNNRPSEARKTEEKILSPEVISTKEAKPPVKRIDATPQTDNLAKAEQEKEIPKVANIDPPSYTSESSENYTREESEPKKEAKKTSLTQKTPGYGMSRNNAAPQIQNNAANQLNYSSNNNMQKESAENLTSVSTNTKDKYAEVDESVSKYQEALIQYNKGHYKRAIRQLEKLLPSSSGVQREDLIYYLAMSHFKQNNAEEANTFFNQLRHSTKYGKLVAPYLDDVKQASPVKKK